MIKRLGLFAITGALALGVVIVLASTALAAFSARGQRQGSATTATFHPVTVAALSGDSPSSTLQPGGQADVILRISNPNSYAVTLVSVSGNGAITASGGVGCTTPGVSFSNVSGLSTPIAASGTTLVHLPGAASMSSASSSGCQGATFSIPVSIVVLES